MSHSSMENCLLNAVNANLFNAEEKEELIKAATKKYLKKTKKKGKLR